VRVQRDPPAVDRHPTCHQTPIATDSQRLPRVRVDRLARTQPEHHVQEVIDMPKKQHLPSVSDKEQRMYEHIKKSELEQGRSTEKAKAIAAATVVKHHNQDDHPSGR
jgi:hypothetical protein